MQTPKDRKAISQMNKVDMSAEAVTARLKRACGLGDAERLATMIKSAMAEIESGKRKSDERHPKKKKT